MSRTVALTVTLAVAAIGGLLAGCAPDPLLVDFAALDRAYIPALATTNLQQADRARAAMDRLQPAYRRFMADHYADKPEDPLWRQDLESVSRNIIDADRKLSEGRLAEAHMALEPIREILRGVRRRAALDYYLDRLADFHEPMEKIVKTAGPVGMTLPDSGVATIRDALPQARRTWQAVAEVSPNPALFDLDRARRQEAEQLVLAESAALDRLEGALSAGDPSAVADAARAIRPSFAQLYMLFGDFSGLPAAPGEQAAP